VEPVSHRRKENVVLRHVAGAPYYWYAICEGIHHHRASGRYLHHRHSRYHRPRVALHLPRQGPRRAAHRRSSDLKCGAMGRGLGSSCYRAPCVRTRWGARLSRVNVGRRHSRDRLFNRSRMSEAGPQPRFGGAFSLEAAGSFWSPPAIEPEASAMALEDGCRLHHHHRMQRLPPDSNRTQARRSATGLRRDRDGWVGVGSGGAGGMRTL
jgi:hypothetical protein